MADNTANQPHPLENLLQAITNLLDDSGAGHTLAQLQQILRIIRDPGAVPVNRRAQRRHQRDSNIFFFGRPENYGPNITYLNAFRFQAGPEIYQLVGSGPGGSLTQDEQRVAGRAMEDIGMPVEELNLE